MISLTTLYSAASSYASAYATASSAALGASGKTATAGGAEESTQVAISEAARQAAKNDTAMSQGYRLPDLVRAMFTKELPEAVVAEAKARLAEANANGGSGGNGISGGVGSEGPLNLPLLPQNLGLLQSFQEEMRSIRSKGLENATPEESARFNQLLNLTMRLQLVGWQKPMTEADVQKELDVALAMARLSAGGAGSSTGGGDAAQGAQDNVAWDLTKIPQVWRDRWSQAGLTMPEEVEVSPGQSMWLSLAEAAGIGADEFMNKARDLAATQQGNALTGAVEHFISDRYLVLKAALENAAA